MKACPHGIAVCEACAIPPLVVVSEAGIAPADLESAQCIVWFRDLDGDELRRKLKEAEEKLGRSQRARASLRAALEHVATHAPRYRHYNSGSRECEIAANTLAFDQSLGD